MTEEQKQVWRARLDSLLMEASDDGGPLFLVVIIDGENCETTCNLEIDGNDGEAARRGIEYLSAAALHSAAERVPEIMARKQ